MLDTYVLCSIYERWCGLTAYVCQVSTTEAQPRTGTPRVKLMAKSTTVRLLGALEHVLFAVDISLTMGQQRRISGQVLYSGVVLHGSALSHGVSSYCDRRELTSRSTAVLPQNAFSLSQSTYVGALANSYRDEINQ